MKCVHAENSINKRPVYRKTVDSVDGQKRACLIVKIISCCHGNINKQPSPLYLKCAHDAANGIYFTSLQCYKKYVLHFSTSARKVK